MINEKFLREKLKSYRVKMGLTEAEVASKLGKSGNSYINRIENGPTKINIEILDELCSLYDIPPVELFDGTSSNVAQNKQPKGFFEKSVFRGVQKLEEDKREEIRNLLPILRKIGKVQKLLNKEPLELKDFSLDVSDFNLKSTFAAQSHAREAATQIRKYFKIDLNSALDVVSFTSNYLNIPICALDLGPECWGLYSSDKLNNPLIIYSNSHKFSQRNVFTIAHEIGHYLFDHDDLNIDCDSNEANVVEKIADTFAQELLVPSIALRQVYDDLGFSMVKELKPHHIVTLSEHFRVSFFMMIVCLRQTQKINSDEYNNLKDFCLNSLANESNSLGYNPQKYLSEPKSLYDQLKELVLIALRKKSLSFFEAGKLLDATEAELRSAI